MRRLTVCLLGSLEVRVDDVPVPSFEYAKVRALLAYLAVEPQRAHSRAQLATLLWPEQPERTARASLSQALTTLRNVLGEKTSAQPVLLADSQSVQLDPSVEVKVDVIQFLDLLRAADAHAHQSWRTCTSCAERLQQALELYRGHFLADFCIPDSVIFEEWAGLQREHLLQRALSALERLAAWAEWRGAFATALNYTQRQVALDPFLEANQRAVMRLLALNGELTAALLQYKQLQRMLARELDAEPEAATTALFEQIRHAEIASLQALPPPFVVPAAPTALVGRSVELHAICTQLRDLKLRTLTIIGTGGIGKTRLALEAAHLLRYDFEDGIYFIELAAVNDAGLVANLLAQVLGLKERPWQSLSDTLRDYLRSKHLLLVLDNFEHVVAAAPLVAELLASCPKLSLLVTSRAPLAIRAEHQFVLEPLPAADAVQLFVQRAQASGAVLAAVAQNISIYTAICQRLDRLPLAIELIAVRARTLSPVELLRQLDWPLQALGHGPRDVPERHRSLWNVMQWSYDLLDMEEQRIFSSLGVFAGGCSREAAQAVLGEEALPILEQLHRASLVQLQSVGGERRFLLLETIREFALEQLNAHDGSIPAPRLSLQRRHAEYFLALLEQAAPDLAEPRRELWVQRLKPEHANLRAALQTLIEAQDGPSALRFVAVLWYFWSDQGYLSQGRDWIERVLALTDVTTATPSIARHEALLGAAFMAFVQDDYACAQHYYEQLLALAQLSGQQIYAAQALDGLGIVVQCVGDLRQARELLEQSITASRTVANQRGEHWTLFSLAFVQAQQGEFDAASLLFEQVVAFNRQHDDAFGLGCALAYYAYTIAYQGSYNAARPRAEEALAIGQRADLPWMQQIALHALGLIALQQETPAVARELFERALVQSRRLGDRLYIALALAYLGLIDLREQAWESAYARLVESLQLAQAISSPKAIILACEGLACLRAVWGQWEHATQLFGAIEMLYLRRGATAPPLSYELQMPYVHAAHISLGQQRFALAWARGQKLTLEAVCALAAALPPVVAHPVPLHSTLDLRLRPASPLVEGGQRELPTRHHKR